MKVHYRDVVASIQNMDHILDVLRPQLGSEHSVVVSLLDARTKLNNFLAEIASL